MRFTVSQYRVHAGALNFRKLAEDIRNACYEDDLRLSEVLGPFLRDALLVSGSDGLSKSEAVELAGAICLEPDHKLIQFAVLRQALNLTPEQVHDLYKGVYCYGRPPDTTNVMALLQMESFLDYPPGTLTDRYHPKSFRR